MLCLSFSSLGLLTLLVITTEVFAVPFPKGGGGGGGHGGGGGKSGGHSSSGSHTAYVGGGGGGGGGSSSGNGSSNNKLTTAQIVGIVVGVFAFVALVLLALFLVTHKQWCRSKWQTLTAGRGQGRGYEAQKEADEAEGDEVIHGSVRRYQEDRGFDVIVAGTSLKGEKEGREQLTTR